MLVHPLIPEPKPIININPQLLLSHSIKKYKTCAINQPATVSPSNVMCQLQCKECPAQYVCLGLDQTKNQFRTGMTGHQQDVQNNYTEKPTVQHAGNTRPILFQQLLHLKIVRPPELHHITTQKMEINLSMVHRLWKPTEHKHRLLLVSLIHQLALCVNYKY